MHFIPTLKTKIPRIIGSPSFPQNSAKYLAPVPNDTPSNVANTMFKHFDIVAPENSRKTLTWKLSIGKEFIKLEKKTLKKINDGQDLYKLNNKIHRRTYLMLDN